MNLLTEGIERGYVIKTDLKKKITIDSTTETYQVYKVKLDCLYYNDQNDRIATWISEYKSKNNVTKLDMHDIKEYNKIIEKFICESNPDAIKRTQNNIKIVEQQEPGVILPDGRVIDGNRRFTCLRNLAKEDIKFEYFETIILESSLEKDAKIIKMLELNLQHGKESRENYNPIDRLVGIYNDLIENELLTINEYVRSTNTTVSDVEENIEIAKLLVGYLEFINAPKQFYIARHMKLDGPLRELYKILNKIKDEEKKEDVRNVVFTNFLMQPDGDMTRFIRKFKTVSSDKKYFDELIDKQLNISEEVLEKLPPKGQVDEKVINELFTNDKEIKDSLREELEKQELKVKAKETRNKPSKMLEKAAEQIELIDTNIFKKLDDEQLSEIIAQIDRINESLGEIKEAVNV